MVEKAQWARALRAYDVAAEMAGESHWLGEFLDGAALAAQQLGRRDVTKRLQAAWNGAPSLVRLLRWLGAGNPSASKVLKRAKQALERPPTKADRQIGLLHLLTGNVGDAAKLLAKAPGPRAVRLHSRRCRVPPPSASRGSSATSAGGTMVTRRCWLLAALRWLRLWEKRRRRPTGWKNCARSTLGSTLSRRSCEERSVRLHLHRITRGRSVVVGRT